jgi:hypothetical protein
MATESTAFKKLQYQFAAHLKDPDHVSAPSDIEDRRMEIYRGLFYRNIQNFIASSFPILRKLYNDENWHKMVRHFFATHQSTTPYFKNISCEFLIYIQKEREPCVEDPIFVKELVHYEWIESYLTFEDIELDMAYIDATGDLLTGVPVLSPLAQIQSYNYPVHKIGPGFQPDQPSKQPTFLMIYRNTQDKVSFMELNPISAMLIELVQNESPKTGQQLLDEIIKTLKHPNPDVVYKGGEQTLKQLHANGILLGTQLP